MSFAVRDGKFDAVIVAGPRVSVWPPVGVRALSALCAQMGLSVGVIGGEVLRAQGVIPMPGTGGLVLAEDVQNRIHRISARAVVRVSPPDWLPNPFLGSHSRGLIPYSTAIKLKAESEISWDPATAILGTGNQALRFGSDLLESGVKQVFCIESFAQWGAKRLAGWEVERRRFEMNGGRILEAQPVSLMQKKPLLWELRLEDVHGILVLEVARVVSVGPFMDLPGIREYPPGSLLFDFVQTSPLVREHDVEGWILEEERGKWLAGRIIKALANDLGSKREEVDKVYRRSRTRLKRYGAHLEQPFTPVYQGKWISAADAQTIRAFSGVPQTTHLARPMASVECFENIGCNVCEKACPEAAIDMTRSHGQILTEDKCAACGVCVAACPSDAIVMMHEKETHSISQLTLPWRGDYGWKVGEFATLVNRRGESLGSARVTAVVESQAETHGRQIQLQIPTHLIWEARSIRKPHLPGLKGEDPGLNEEPVTQNRVNITIDGEKRLVRGGVPVSIALFETGQSRNNDQLLCGDGSCGLCQITVDGIKKLACQTGVHRGMAIRLETHTVVATEHSEDLLCPCLGVTQNEVIERLHQGKLQSPEALLSVTHVGEGRCHGQLCMGAFRRLLAQQGVDASNWIDWRFPWSDWVLTSGPHE